MVPGPSGRLERGLHDPAGAAGAWGAGSCCAGGGGWRPGRASREPAHDLPRHARGSAAADPGCGCGAAAACGYGGLWRGACPGGVFGGGGGGGCFGGGGPRGGFGLGGGGGGT